MMEDYEVGYGKPPKATRFKPERSGNPKGRPRGRRNKRSVIRGVIDRKVTLRKNGKTRRVSVFEALVESLVAKALKGSINDQLKLIQLIDKYAPSNPEKHVPEETRPDLSALTDEDLRGLRALIRGRGDSVMDLERRPMCGDWTQADFERGWVGASPPVSGVAATATAATVRWPRQGT